MEGLNGPKTGHLLAYSSAYRPTLQLLAPETGLGYGGKTGRQGHNRGSFGLAVTALSGVVRL